MNSNETVNKLCCVLKLIHEYCEGRVVWGDADRERWEHVSRLAKQALKSAEAKWHSSTSACFTDSFRRKALF